MRPIDLKSKILTLSAWLATLILVLMPFHAFLTVWGSSIVGHYTLLRLWKEGLLIIMLVAALYLIVAYRDKLPQSLDRRLFWLIVSYIVVNLIWGGVAYAKHGVNLKALGYGLIVNLRFLGFFLVTWLISRHSNWLRDNWLKIVLWPASLVVAFGLLQIFVLPYDFLRHFGYNVNLTIPPFETINSNTHYVRIISTLRGANPLGAYLVIPITALTYIVWRGQRNWKHLLLMAGSLLALVFSFSRSAWLGTLLSIATVMLINSRAIFNKKTVLYAVSLGIVLLAGLGFGLRHNPRVENVLLHTQTNSAVKTTSNSGHIAALKAGVSDLAHEPLGRGPGSAGPASVYNNHPARIAENYYVQIGQELGWIGMAVFLLINAYLAYMLWLRRSDALALSLLASLIGISFINLLSHAWTDDTLAYIWWGLAGIAIASNAGKTDDTDVKKPV